VLDFWFLVFLGFIRVSGTISGAYNSDRAELQAAIVMSSVLGLAPASFPLGDYHFRGREHPGHVGL
jgi:hypothetical protein